MKKWLAIALGILTATGGFVDVGAVATAGEAGATFGLGLVWAMLLGTLAIMLLVEMSGRLTAVSGKTYADAIRERFGFKFYLFPLTSELLANSLMLSAELGGVAIALSLVTGLNWRPLLPIVALLVWLLVWRAPFGLIENGPALLGLVTLSFWVGIVALGGLPRELLPTLWRPSIKDGDLARYCFLAAAILGAIISPYLIFFYSSGAREEGWTKRSLVVNRVSAVLGMGFGSSTAIALIVLAAIVLGPLHMGGSTLGEGGLAMAAALGPLGSLLFAFALFITCLSASLEVVLSVGYNVSQGFGWEWGEEKKPVEAPRFNLILTFFMIEAAVVGVLGPDPLDLALYGSAFTALVLPISLGPFLIFMNDPAYLSDRTNGRFANVATMGVLGVATVVAIVSIPLLILSGG